MKKHSFLFYIFPFGYAFFGVTAFKCGLDLLSLTLSPFAGNFPYLVPFLIVAFFVSFIACLALLIWNVKLLLDEDEKSPFRIVAELAMTVALIYPCNLLCNVLVEWLKNNF